MQPQVTKNQNKPQEKPQYIALYVGNAGEIFSLGIFTDIEKAWGRIMLNIWEKAYDYQDPKDEFKIGLPDVDDYGDLFIEIEFKYHSWDKSIREEYRIISAN